MAAPAGRLTDARYINWVKDTLALIYLKDGLEVFVDNQSAVFHSHLITTLGSQACGTCSCRDLVKRKGQWTINCPVCQPWLTEIISKHKYRPLPFLAPGNTDPQLWTTDAWEVMKLYQAKGCQDQHSARDTDVAGILAVIGNCDHFHSFLSNLKLVDEIREIRNRCMHSSDLHVETVDLGTDLQTMLQFLRGLMSLSAAEQAAVDKAIEKIEELQTSTLDLSLNKGLELQALQENQCAIASELICLKQELATVKADLGASNAKRAKLETDLTEKIASVEERLKQLQAVQDSFNRFLQANNLVQDMARLSTALEHHDQRIKNVETQAQQLDVTTKQQECEMATLYQRQQAHEGQLKSQHDKIGNIEARLHNQTGSEASGMTEEAIAERMCRDVVSVIRAFELTQLNMSQSRIDIPGGAYHGPLITMPDSSASVERHFNIMRRVKNYMRSTLSTDPPMSPEVEIAKRTVPDQPPPFQAVSDQELHSLPYKYVFS